MSDIHTPDQRHRNMAAIHSASTKPELKLRHTLWRLGFRYRINDRRLPGSPDIVLPKYHTVIFVHGCFWHGHLGCKKFTIPKSNTAFWTAKIQSNQQRDQDVWRKLEAKGWAVIIVWECELEKERLQDTTSRLTISLNRNLESFLQLKKQRSFNRSAYLEETNRKKALRNLVKQEMKRNG